MAGSIHLVLIKEFTEDKNKNKNKNTLLALDSIPKIWITWGLKMTKETPNRQRSRSWLGTVGQAKSTKKYIKV